MSLYTSRDEFDLEKRVHLTNEIPPYDMYDALNSTLQNELWQWVLGYTRVTFDMPYAIKKLNDDDTVSMVRNVEEGNVFYKLINGEYSENYGPVGTVDDDLTYPQLEEYGVVLPEFDYLLHEVYRYLDTLYPDHPDYMELLTNNEFNDMITNAGAIIDYDPNNAFFEKVASSLGISENDVDLESAMIKIRNLKDEAFRRKLYGSKSGYHMFASDIYQNVTVFPVATYLPLKPNLWNSVVSEFGEGSPYNQGEGDLESLKAWNAENGTNYSVDDYVKHILTKNRVIDTYSKLYYSKFRLIDYDGSKSSYPVPKDNNIYISAFSLPFNEYSIFEYPVSSDADSMLIEATSGMVSDKNDVKGTNYITELNVDIPQLVPTTSALISDSKKNINKLKYSLEESNGREVHSISTSLKNAVDFQKLYVYPYVEDINVSASSFDSLMLGVECQDDEYPLVEESGIVTVRNPFGDFFKGVSSDVDVKEIKAIYNPIDTDTLYLSSDATLGFYPTEVGCYYDVSNLGGGYFCKETPVLWGKYGSGIDKLSYLTSDKMDSASDTIAQVVGFTKGYIGFVNDSVSQYRSSKISSIPDKDESYGRDRFAFVVENEHGYKVFFEGNLHNEDFPNQSRTVAISGGVSTFTFGTNGVTLFETIQGNNYHADYVELQVTAIPDKKTPSIMKSVYGDEYYELLSEEVNMNTDEKVGTIPRERDWLNIVVNNYEKNHLLNAEEYELKKQEIYDWLDENKDIYNLYKWGNTKEDFIFEHYYADDQIVTINGKVRNLGEEIYYLVKDLLGYIRMDTSEFMEHMKLYKESKDRYDQMVENRAFIYEKDIRTLESGETEDIISSLIQPGCKVAGVYEGVVSYEKDTLKPYISYSSATEFGFGLITNISLGHLDVVSLLDKNADMGITSPAYDNSLASNSCEYFRRVKKQVTNKCEIHLNSEEAMVPFVERFLSSVSSYENVNGEIVPISSTLDTDLMFMQNAPFIDGQDELCADSTYRVNDAENKYALSNGEYKVLDMGTRYKYDMFNEEYFVDDDGSFVKTLNDDTYTPIANVCERKTIYRNIEFDYENFIIKFDRVVQDGVQTVKYNYINVDRAKIVPSQYTLSVSEIYQKSRNVAIIDTLGDANAYATGTLSNLTLSSVETGSFGNNIQVRFKTTNELSSLTISLYGVDVYHKGGIKQENRDSMQDTSTGSYYTEGADFVDGNGNKHTNFLKNSYVNIKWNGFTIKDGVVNLSGGYYSLSEYYDLINDRVENPFVIKSYLYKMFEYIFDYNSPIVSLMGDTFRDYVAGNYFAGKDSANVVISDDERTELKIESVIDISEGRENIISFESDLAKEMMKSLSVGDKVYGPSLDTDDNDIYIRSIGDNEVTVSQPLQQSGTFVLTFYVKVNIYPDDLTDDMLYYKESLYKNGLYSVKNPYEHGLFGSSDYPRISNALLDSLPDISFFDLTPSSMPGSWNVPSMNEGGDTTFQWLLKETHYDDYDEYILSRKNSVNAHTASPYKLLPSDIKFNNELFVEYNLNRLLKYPSRNGDSTVLMSVDWLDYMETNLSIVSRATDKVNVGVNLMLETDTSGYYTWLPNQKYTDPNIQSKFMTLNFHNNKWPERGIMDDDWTVPAYAQIGSGGSGRKDMFKNPNDITYPNMFGVSLYNDYVPSDQYSEKSDLVKSNGKLNTVTLYADKGVIIGSNSETSIGADYDTVENPLFEVPLGEYNTVLKYKPSTSGDSDDLLGTVTQVSFHEQTFKDLTQYFDESDDVICVQNENSESMGILSYLDRRETLNKGVVLDGRGESLTNFVYGGDWIPEVKTESRVIDGQSKDVNVIDYSKLTVGRYYYVSDNTNYTDMADGERGSFSKGDIIFVYRGSDNKNVYDTRSFQFICPFGDKYEDEDSSEDVVSSLSYPAYDENGKSVALTNKKKKTILDSEGKVVETIDDPTDINTNADVFTRLMQYYFRVSGNYTANQVKEEINKCTLERLLDTYNTSGSLEESKKILDTHILYYAYVGSKESTSSGWDLKKRYFGSDIAKYISEGDRVAMVYINGYFYLFKLSNTSIYGVSLPVKALGAGLLQSELKVMNGKIKLSKSDSNSTTMRMNNFMSKLDLPHGNITPGSYEFNFTLDPHFVSTGYPYEDDGVTLDKTKDTISFCITRGAIYYDSKNDEFYCYSKALDPNSGEFVGDVRKIAIVFNENSYFKNILNINGTYQVTNTIESESGEVKATPVFKPITGIDFQLDKVASNDRILGAKLIDLRSIYNRALEPTYFSTFAKVSYGIYGLNPREILLAPVPDDTGVNKAKFVATINDIYPQVAEYDEDKNVITVRDGGIDDGFNFVDDNTLVFPTVYDQIGLYHTEILRSPLRDTYVTDATQSLDNFEFKYFKNTLVVRAALNLAAPNTIVAPSKDASLYFMALGELGLGDTVVGGVSLSNMGFENKFSVLLENSDDSSDTIKVRKLCYADGHMLVLAMNAGIYYADDLDIGSISGKVSLKKSLIRLENDAVPMDASFDYDKSSWMVEAGDLATKNTDIYQLPISMLGVPDQEPYLSVYKTNSSVFIKSDNKTLFVGGSVDAKWDDTDNLPDNLEQADENYYLDLDNKAIVKDFISMEVSTGQINDGEYTHRDALYRDIAISYGNLTEESHISGEELILTVNPATAEDDDVPSTGDMDYDRSPMFDSKDITMEPYYVDSLRLVTGNGTNVPIDEGFIATRAVHVSSSSKKYALYAKGRDAFIKSPTALIVPKKDVSGNYYLLDDKSGDYSKGYEYSGETTMDSYWKRVRIPTISDKLYYNLRSMVSENVDKLYELLDSDAQDAFSKFGAFENVYKTADTSVQESLYDDMSNLYTIQISGKTGFDKIKLDEVSKTAVKGMSRVLTKITGYKNFTSNGDTSVDKEDGAPYIATFDHFETAMDSAKASAKTEVTVEGTNSLLTIKYDSGKWYIRQYGFELKEMSIKDIEFGSYIGSTLYKVPTFTNVNESGEFSDSTVKFLEYTVEDNDLTPDYKSAYAWYAYYLDYYLFGNASFSEYVLTSNISSAFFTAGSLMITDTYGGLAKIDLGNLTKREDIENPDNWMVSSLPSDFCYIREDSNLSGGYYYSYRGSLLKVGKSNAIISSTIFKPECLYNNDGIIIMGGYIYSKDKIEELYLEMYTKYGEETLTDELKENLESLQSKSMFKELTCPAAFYSTDGGSSFKPIPISDLDLLSKDSRINNEMLNTCIGSIRFFNDEYQFNIARVQDVENPEGTPVDFTYYYRIVKDENTGLYNFNQVTSDSESGLEFADKDAETLSLGNAEEFDVDFTTGVKEKDDTSGEDFTGAGASGTVRFFVTPNRNSFYLATSSGLNLSGNVAVSSKTTTTLTLSENLVPVSTGKIDVLLSFNTSKDILDQMQYLNADNMDSYLNGHGSLRLDEIVEVDGKATANRFYSYRELLEDPTDKNGYPTVDEDTNHVYYNYTSVEMVSGETSLVPDLMKNDSGNALKLCNEDGILFGRDMYGSRLYTITDRIGLPMESYLDAHDTKFATLEALDSSFDEGDTALVPLEKDTLLTRVLDMGDEMMKVTRISKDVGTPGINISIHLKGEITDIDSENDLIENVTVDENDNDTGVLYLFDYLEPTKLFASYLLKVTKEITQEQFNLCVLEDDEKKQLEKFQTLIQSIQKPSIDGSVEYRYMNKQTSTSKRNYWYDDYFGVYPLAYRRVLSAYLDMPYYFAGLHGYKGEDVSVVNSPDYSPLSGVYISQYGYGGTRNNTDVNWSNKLPWTIDPDAFIKVTDLDGDSTNDDLYLKNTLGGYIYLTDNTGKKIYSLNSEKIMKSEDIFEVSDVNISSSGEQKMTVEDSLGNKSSVSAYRIQQAKVKTYTPMKEAVLGTQPFEWSFYAYKPGMLVNEEITDVSIAYLYNNSDIVESCDASVEFDVDKIKLGLLSYKGLEDDSSEMYFMDTYGIYPEQLSITFKYKDKYENHRISLSLGEKSSSTIVMSRPLFYMRNTKDDNYSLVPYLFSRLDFAKEGENDITTIDDFGDIEWAVIPGYFYDTSLEITVSKFEESVYCANETDFAPLSYMPVMINEGTIFPEESETIELSFNTFGISSIETPSVNLSTYKSNESLFNIDLPIFTFGDVLAFALVSIDGVRHNYWDDLNIDTSCRLYLDDTQLSIGSDKSLIMELDEENHKLNFGIQDMVSTMGLIYDPSTKIRFMLKSIDMNLKPSFYSMDGKHISTHDMMLDENGDLRPRFIDLSVYDKLNLSIIDDYDYKIRFPLYIIDKFQGNYINELNSSLAICNWTIKYKVSSGEYLTIDDTPIRQTFFRFKAPYLESVDFTSPDVNLHTLYDSDVVALEITFDYDGMTFIKALPISWGYMVTPEISDTYASVAYKKDSSSVNTTAKTIKILPERNMARLDYPDGLDTLTLGSGEPLTLTAMTYDLPSFNSSMIGSYDRDTIADELEGIAVSKTTTGLRSLLWDVEPFDNSFKDSTNEYKLTRFLQGFDYSISDDESYSKRAAYLIATVLGDVLADREKPSSIMNNIDGFIGEVGNVGTEDGGVSMDTWYETVSDGTGFKNLVDNEEAVYKATLTKIIMDFLNLQAAYTDKNILYNKDTEHSYAKVFKDFDSFMYLLDDKSIASCYSNLDLSSKEYLDKVLEKHFEAINILIKKAKIRTAELYDDFYIKDSYTEHARGVITRYEIGNDFDLLTDFINEITNEGEVRDILVYSDNVNNFARKELLKIAHYYRKCVVETGDSIDNYFGKRAYYEIDDDGEVYVSYKGAYYHIDSPNFVKWLYDLNEGVRVIKNYNGYQADIEDGNGSVSSVHLEVDDNNSYTFSLGVNEIRNFGCQITIDDKSLCENNDGLNFGDESEVIVDGEKKIIHDYSIFIDSDYIISINPEGIINVPEEISFDNFKDMYDDIDVIREVFSYSTDYGNEYTEKIASFVDNRGYNSFDKKAGDELSTLVESSLYSGFDILDDVRYIESEEIKLNTSSVDALKSYLEKVLEMYKELASAKLDVDYAVFGELLSFINKDIKLRNDIYNNFKGLWKFVEGGNEYEYGHVEVTEPDKFPLNFKASDYGTYKHEELNEMLQSLGYTFSGDLENPLRTIDFQNGSSYKLMDTIHYMKKPEESLMALAKYDELKQLGEHLCEKMFWIGRIAHVASDSNEIAVVVSRDDIVKFTNDYPEYSDSDNIMATYRNSLAEKNSSEEVYTLQMENTNSLILESKEYLNSISSTLYLKDATTNILNTVYSRYESTSSLSDIDMFMNGDGNSVKGILLNGSVQDILYKCEVHRRESLEKSLDRVADRYTTLQRVKDDGIVYEYIDNEAMLYMDDCYYYMDKESFDEWLKNLNASGKVTIDYYGYKLFDSDENLYKLNVDDGYSITVGETGTFVIANGEQISLDGFRSLWDDMDDIDKEFRKYALDDDYNDYTKDVYGFFADNEITYESISNLVDIVFERNKEYPIRTLEYASYEVEPQMHDYMERISVEYGILVSDFDRMNQCTNAYNNALDNLQNKRAEILKQVLLIANRKIIDIEDLDGIRGISEILEKSNAYIQTNESSDNKGILKLTYTDPIFTDFSDVSFLDERKDAIAEVVVGIVNEEDEVFHRVTSESLENLLLEYQFNYTGIKRNIFGISSDGTSPYSDIFVEQFRNQFNSFFGDGFMNNYNAYYKLANDYFDSVIRVMTEYTRQTMGSVNITYPEPDKGISLNVAVGRGGKLPRYVDDLEQVFYDYVKYDDVVDGETVEKAENLKNYLYHHLMVFMGNLEDTFASELYGTFGLSELPEKPWEIELPKVPELPNGVSINSRFWQEYAKYRYMRISRNKIDEWHATTKTEVVLLRDDYTSLKEGRVCVFAENVNEKNRTQENGFTPIIPSKFFASQNTLTQGFTRPNLKADYPDTVDTRTVIDLGYYSLLSVFNDPATTGRELILYYDDADKRVDESLHLPKYKDGMKYIIEDFNSLEDSRIYHNDLELPYLRFSDIFWEYKDGKNIVPYVDTGCGYMLTFVGETYTDDEGVEHKKYSTPVVVKDGDNIVSTDSIILKVTKLSKDEPDTALVTGISDYIKFRKPKYESMYELISSLGYVIDNPNNILAVSVDSNGKYLPNSLDNVSFNIVDTDNSLANFTSELSLNEMIYKSAASLGVKLDDGNEHYLQLKLLTHSSVSTDLATANDNEQFVKLNLSDIVEFTPDRVYYHPDGYSAPPFRLHNLVFNGENIDNYNTNFYKNNNLEKVYRCNSEGMLVGYNFLSGSRAESFDIVNDTTCAGYLTDDETGKVSSVVQMYVLDSSKNTIKNAVNTYEPLYKSCKDWFKEGFYVEGKESNPYWQALVIDSKFDNMMKQWKQRTRVVEYVRSSTQMVEQEVDESLRYLNVSPAIKPIIINDELDIEYNADFVDMSTGELRFFVRQPTEYYKNTKSFVKYGISASNSFYKSGTSPYRAIWIGSNIDMSGSVSSSYTINSFRNFANKNDRDHAIRQVTEFGLFNKYHEMIAYATFPPIEYRTDSQHISFTCYIKMGSCK